MDFSDCFDDEFQTALGLRPVPLLFWLLAFESADAPFPEAEVAARRTIVLDPGSATAYGLLGLALAQRRSYADMRGAFRRAHALSGHHAPLFWLAIAELRNRNVGAGFERMTAWLNDTGQDDGAHLLLTEHFLPNEPSPLSDGLHGLLLSRLAAGDRQPALLFLVAVRLWHLGFESDAVPLYAEAAHRNSTFAIGRLFAAARAFFSQSPNARDPIDSLPRTASRTYGPIAPPDVPEVMIGCDVQYFRKFAVPLLRSLDEHCRRCAVALLLYDADSSIVDGLPVFAAGLPRLHLTVVFETIDFAGKSPEVRRIWYTALRLVRLAQSLRVSPRPVLMLDADALIRAEIARLFDHVAGYDIGASNTNRVEPYMKILAGALLVQPTATARDYIDLVGRYVARCLLDGSACFLIDQLALELCRRQLAMAGRAPRLLDFQSAGVHRAFHSTIELQPSDFMERRLRAVPDSWRRFP